MHFDNDLSDVGPPPLPIVIAQWNKHVRAILCCTQWCGVWTHWFGGHTIACCQTVNCRACEANQAPVKKYYIVGRNPQNDHLAILMLTPLAAEELARYRSREHGFLGCEIILGRAAKRNTSPMTVRVIATHPDESEFSQESLKRCICRIFRENNGEHPLPPSP